MRKQLLDFANAKHETFEDRFMIFHAPLMSRYDPSESFVHGFAVFEVACWDASDAPQYEAKNGKGWTPSHEKAEAFLHGHIKWDGCANLQFHDGDCMLHFCGFRNAMAVGRLLERMYILAAEAMGGLDWCAGMAPEYTKKP